MADFTSGSRGSGSSSGGSSTLNSLIASLMKQYKKGSGDPAARQTAIDRETQTQTDYTKEQAFADAQALMDNQVNKILQDQLPTMTLAAEGAGASGSSMRALLLNKLTNQAASDAAALGAQQAVDYGQISNQAGSVLEQLTASDPTVLNGLLDAIKLQQALAQQSLASQVQNVPNSTPVTKPTIGGKPSASQQSGLAQAVFLPSAQQPSTSSFFNRPGGILDNSQGGMVGYGPSASYNPAAELAKLQQGLAPSQQWEGIPGAANLYSSGLKF